MRTAPALCVLLCAALAGGAPNLLPGDPRLSDPSHHHHDHHDHGHGDHAAHDHADHHGHHGAGHDAAAAQGVPDLKIANGVGSGNPPLSATQGVPDLQFTSDGGAYGVGTPVVAPPARQSSPVSVGPPTRVFSGRPSGGRPANPFLTGAINPPSSSLFQVPVKPVLPVAQRPTPEPILEVNTNPLGGPAGPKGPVRASCPGPASALPCVREAECDPYTGFLKSDGYKLPYPITKDTPTVAIGQCKLPAGRIGVCCKRLPKPKPTVPTTSLPLGVDYGQGLADIKPKPTPSKPNPFLPNYNPSS